MRDLELGEQVALGLGELGGLPEGAGRAGEGAEGEQIQLVGDRGPGGAGGRLGDGDTKQQGGQPRCVRADAFFLAVAGRAQVDDLFQVAPAALDFQELVLAQRDVLGREPGVGGAEQVLAVDEVPLGLHSRRVDAEQAAGGARR